MHYRKFSSLNNFLFLITSPYSSKISSRFFNSYYHEYYRSQNFPEVLYNTFISVSLAGICSHGQLLQRKQGNGVFILSFNAQLEISGFITKKKKYNKYWELLVVIVIYP